MTHDPVWEQDCHDRSAPTKQCYDMNKDVGDE